MGNNINHTTQEDTIRNFLELPPESLPGVRYDDPAVHDGGGRNDHWWECDTGEAPISLGDPRDLLHKYIAEKDHDTDDIFGRVGIRLTSANRGIDCQVRV